jgi:hypothetical protein
MPRSTEVGTILNYKGQRYEIEGEYMYARRNDWNGPLIPMLQLASNCADCGRMFFCSIVKSRFGKRPLNRRCKSCRKPGRSVTHIHPLAAAAHTRRHSAKATGRLPSPASRHGTPPPVASVPPQPLAPATLAAIAPGLGSDLSAWWPLAPDTLAAIAAGAGLPAWRPLPPETLAAIAAGLGAGLSSWRPPDGQTSA